MKKNITGWIIGGLITASVLGVTFGVTSVSNAAKNTEHETSAPSMMANMMQDCKMKQEMMNSPEMHKQCGEMMKAVPKENSN